MVKIPEFPYGNSRKIGFNTGVLSNTRPSCAPMGACKKYFELLGGLHWQTICL